MNSLSFIAEDLTGERREIPAGSVRQAHSAARYSERIIGIAIIPADFASQGSEEPASVAACV